MYAKDKLDFLSSQTKDPLAEMNEEPDNFSKIPDVPPPNLEEIANDMYS